MSAGLVIRLGSRMPPELRDVAAQVGPPCLSRPTLGEFWALQRWRAEQREAAESLRELLLDRFVGIEVWVVDPDSVLAVRQPTQGAAFEDVVVRPGESVAVFPDHIERLVPGVGAAEKG